MAFPPSDPVNRGPNSGAGVRDLSPDKNVIAFNYARLRAPRYWLNPRNAPETTTYECNQSAEDETG